VGRQLFQDGPYNDPPVASGTALVATTIQDMWLGLQFTPIFANDPKAGKIYTVKAGGIISTSASASTMIITPSVGTGATTLGTSQTVTMPASLSNVPWHLEFNLIFRVIDPAGSTASTAFGTGVFTTCPAASAPTGAQACVIPFGGTAVTNINATANTSITIAKTLSVAGSFTTGYAFIFSRN
jgi:hypothetical protein